MIDREQHITPEYLLSHGFRQYHSADDGYWYQIPFLNEADLHFVEIDPNRNVFVVVISAPMNDDESYDCITVYIQEDAGCGFIEMPYRWCGFPVDFFEALYYSFYGYKPKSNNS